MTDVHDACDGDNVDDNLHTHASRRAHRMTALWEHVLERLGHEAQTTQDVDGDVGTALTP